MPEQKTYTATTTRKLLTLAAQAETRAAVEVQATKWPIVTALVIHLPAKPDWWWFYIFRVFEEPFAS